MELYEVIRRPLITEKHTAAQAYGKYAFEVNKNANKPQVKQAVEKAFKVSVVSVNVMNMPGRSRRRGAKIVPPKPWRKAVVTLKPGDKIELFEGTT